MILRTELLRTGYNVLKLLLVFPLLALGSGVSYAADPGKGDEFYAKHCATCHGASGASVMPGAPDFGRSAVILMQPDTTLLSSIKAGKNAMPAYRGILSDQDILDVIAYLRTLN